MSIKVSIFWFRRDLRLHDNHGLSEALRSGYPIVPVFIFDQNILASLGNREDRRVNFIYRGLEKINAQLTELGSSIFVIHGSPLAAFETLCGHFDVKEVFTNGDYEPYAVARDQEVSKFLKSKSILFHSFKDQVVFEKSEIVKKDGSPYRIFTPYSRAWKEKFKAQNHVSYESEALIEGYFKTKPFPFPSLNDIGFSYKHFEIPSPAIDRITVSNYGETRNIPSVEGTTRGGVHLRFGTVSIREFVRLASESSEALLNELIWREFFMMILFHFPRVVTESFKKEYDSIPWRNDEKEFESWCKGETGYPIVDAGMRQLNETGFMHNRVRMIVASFLTKHLLIDWRWGEGYFAEKLLDYELASNNGNWQWAAGSGCDAAPYFRIFNPHHQTKRFDPELSYVRKWIRNFDAYHLQPIVDHETARRRAVDVYQKALKNFRGGHQA